MEKFGYSDEIFYGRDVVLIMKMMLKLLPHKIYGLYRLKAIRVDGNKARTTRTSTNSPNPNVDLS